MERVRKLNRYHILFILTDGDIEVSMHAFASPRPR